MKKLIAALLASAVMLPMLSHAQSAQPQRGGTANRPESHSYDHVYDREYGASADGNVQSGWTTQPSPQALGQSLFKHH
ncbi:hypothetical protein AWB74_00996 [Caballeronia arvi]|uniref:Lipoprotein n=1 Tax=Caballeronia arvi TaxID=1777135 RepID=A0A158FXE7_9BURK|nr:hypothetical protein [Caballeronia arvi]SAL24524.1 hypothetical protein AWB74_00996 [Caballeronia arvi]